MTTSPLFVAGISNKLFYVNICSINRDMKPENILLDDNGKFTTSSAVVFLSKVLSFFD